MRTTRNRKSRKNRKIKNSITKNKSSVYKIVTSVISVKNVVSCIVLMFFVYILGIFLNVVTLTRKSEDFLEAMILSTKTKQQDRSSAPTKVLIVIHHHTKTNRNLWQTFLPKEIYFGGLFLRSVYIGCRYSDCPP